MLLAVWRRGGGPPCGALDIERVIPALEAADHASRGWSTIWTTAPARLEQCGALAVGWQYSGRAAHEVATAPGPHVLLDEHGIEATVGPLPHFPLYFHANADGSRLVICSELAPLLRIAPGLPVNLRRLVSIMAWRADADPDATAFMGLRRLRAGERLVADREGIRSSVELPRAGERHYRESHPVELARELRSHLEAAVRGAIGDARRVAVFCGGGVDSSGVLALTLARCRGADRRDVEALAEVWASPGDDRPHLKTLERELGIVAVRLGAREAAPWFMSSLRSDGQPQVFPAACAEILLWETARARRADVALGGHAGDVISGSEPSFASLLLRGHPLRAVGQLRPVFRPALPRSVLMRRRKRAARRPWMTPRFLQILESMLEKIPVREPRSPDEWLAHFCQHPVLAETTVSWGQVASETRFLAVDVFRDFELVRFVSQIDPNVRSHGHASRGLYRLAMQGLVPDSVRLRPDKALGFPLVAEAAVAAGGRDVLRDLSSLRELAALGLVDPEPYRSAFAAWLAVLMRGERSDSDPTDRTWHEVWLPLVAEAFLRDLPAERAAADVA